MFGSVFVSFQNHMQEVLGPKGWKELLVDAGLPADKVYRTARFYPDNEFITLLDLAAIRTGILKDTLYKKLGKDFGKHLIKTYHRMFFSSWKTLDVIEKVAPIVYKTIQIVDPRSPQSEVKCTRVSPTEVVVYYMSPRKMCAYVLGIIDAMAEHFGEKIVVSHTKCMHRGEARCEIHVNLFIPVILRKPAVLK